VWFEPQRVVESQRAFVVDIDIEYQLPTPGVYCPLSCTLYQCPSESGPPVLLPDVDVTHFQSVGPVENRRARLDIRRDEPCKGAVSGEIHSGLVGDAIDGNPRSIRLGFQQVPSELNFTVEVNLVCECVCVDASARSRWYGNHSSSACRRSTVSSVGSECSSMSGL
jgi:hypothetical protein